MLKKLSAEAKVGIFSVICLAIIIVFTIKVGDRSIVAGGGYTMDVVMKSAIGIKNKTPVEIAGIQIGVVKKIKLADDHQAMVTLLLNRKVALPDGTVAYVRSKGFLGQTYIEIVPGTGELYLEKGTDIPYGGVRGDLNMLMGQFNDIARDIKSVSSALRGTDEADKDSPIYKTVNNLDKFTAALTDITLKNEQNLNRVISNMAILTDQLQRVVQRSRYDIESTVANISDITQKVNEGKGTLGRLVNDETTINNLNEAIDNLNETLGGMKRLETDIGYHAEYLGNSKEVKHYVHLDLKPTPDEAFLFEFISDPDPRPSWVERDVTITAGGTTSTVQTDTATIDRSKFKFSAMLAKKFYDFRFRGGIIESSGGLGIDYQKGPVGASFSAFDFGSRFGEKPHLKAMANVDIFKGFYLVGGADDMLNPYQPTDWFVGAGLRITDDDVKSILGLGAKAANQ